MKTFLLKINNEIKLYKTMSALIADNSTEQLGISGHTLSRHKFDASTNWKYENVKIQILEKTAKGMAEVVLSKLAVAIFEAGIEVTVRKSREVEAKGFVFIYKKNIILKSTGEVFESIEDVLRELQK